MNKYFLIILLLIPTILVFKSTIKSELTSRLAAKKSSKLNAKNYYETLDELRNKSQDFLNKIETSIEEDVLKLKQENKHNTAEILQKNYKKIYAHFSQEIDEIFENLDKEFVLTSKDYNDDQLSDLEKLEFVEKMKKIATQKINEITSKNVDEIKKHLYRY